MKLTDLLKSIGIKNLDLSDSDIDVLGITQDSRNTKPGYIFFDTSCNQNFVETALHKGAISVITNQASLIHRERSIFMDQNPRLAYAKAAAALYPHTIKTILAVTGTNGKTSTVDFIRQLFEKSGSHAASAGTVGVFGKNTEGIRISGLTTPDAKDMHKLLSKLSSRGVDTFAFEASSHGLDQCRIHGISVSYAGFTNLTQDHLDYHEDMESYFQAKTKLFTEVLSPTGTAVINKDCPYGQRLIETCSHKKIRTLTYSTKDASADILARVEKYYGRGMQIHIAYQEESITVDVNIVGAFQLENILCALGMVLLEKKCTLTMLKEVIAQLKSPVGRMEHVATTDVGADIFIDYAHTPDALKRALDTIQAHTKNRVYVVFGCGGDRDKEKRPLMGQISKKHAHFSIITDDNPRSEDPDDIRAQIRVNHPLALDVPGRANAIAKGISLLKAGDSLLIAGKGHEETQTFKDETLPFSDRLVVIECLQKKAV